MKNTYPNLLRPGYIGKMRVPNRLVFAPIGSANNTKDGHVSQATLDYYEALAAGGTGLLVLEATYIDNVASKGEEGQLSAADNSCTPGLARLASMIHNHYGVKAAVQLCHIGQQLGLAGESPSWGPSSIDITYTGSPISIHGMSEEEILATIENFAKAAFRVKKAGFDAVEIHASGGHLLQMFLSPEFNKREDQWGGSLENRARFTVEAIKAVKAACGKDFPVLVRLACDELIPDDEHFHVEDGIEFARMFEAAGADAIDMNAGNLNTGIPTMFDPIATHAEYAAKYKQAGIGIPIIIAGSIVTPAVAEEVLAKGQADFAGVARPLLADPDWIAKIKAGTPEQIRPCIRCSMGCVGTLEDFNAARGIFCSVNPYCNRTTVRKIKPLAAKKRVAVVGGGPGGMEAACMAAERGHDVDLFEKRELGGTMIEAAFDPVIKGDIKRLITFYKNRVAATDINVIYEEATAERLLSGGYDAIVIATGAEARKSKVPGVDLPNVYQDIEVCGGKQGELGNPVVVVGGGVVAAEIAISEAMKGKEVIISTRRGAEMGPYEVAKDDSSPNWIRILDLLGRYDVDIQLCQTLVSIEEDGITVHSAWSDEDEKVEAESVVLCTGYASNQRLFDELDGKFDELYLVGDAVAPREIGNAVVEGWVVGNEL